MDPTTQQGVAMAVIALVSVAIGRLFDWLTKRLDSRLASLELAVRACEQQHATCQDERARDKAELKARDDHDKAELKAEIASLRNQVTQKKDRTDGHSPL